MSAEVISLRPSQADLEAAWAAYDAARMQLERLYAFPVSSTDNERFNAAIQAVRAHQAFYRLAKRMEGM